ncbi:hypothetical protein V8C86DRAFT_2432176 [Haematococcus lacustris]
MGSLEERHCEEEKQQGQQSQRQTALTNPGLTKFAVKRLLSSPAQRLRTAPLSLSPSQSGLPNSTDGKAATSVNKGASSSLGQGASRLAAAAASKPTWPAQRVMSSTTWTRHGPSRQLQTPSMGLAAAPSFVDWPITQCSEMRTVPAACVGGSCVEAATPTQCVRDTVLGEVPGAVSCHALLQEAAEGAPGQAAANPEPDMLAAATSAVPESYADAELAAMLTDLRIAARAAAIDSRPSHTTDYTSMEMVSTLSVTMVASQAQQAPPPSSPQAPAAALGPYPLDAQQQHVQLSSATLYAHQPQPLTLGQSRPAAPPFTSPPGHSLKLDFSYIHLMHLSWRKVAFQLQHWPGPGAAGGGQPAAAEPCQSREGGARGARHISGADPCPPLSPQPRPPPTPSPHDPPCGLTQLADHYRPAQPSPAQPSPAQPSPAQPSPAQPSPAQPSPAQPSPAQPSQPSPAQPSPAQPSPAQPSPAQPSPAQPSPAQPSPAQPAQPSLTKGLALQVPQAPQLLHVCLHLLEICHRIVELLVEPLNFCP